MLVPLPRPASIPVLRPETRVAYAFEDRPNWYEPVFYGNLTIAERESVRWHETLNRWVGGVEPAGSNDPCE